MPRRTWHCFDGDAWHFVELTVCEGEAADEEDREPPAMLVRIHGV